MRSASARRRATPTLARRGVALAKARERERGLAQVLRRQRAGVDARAAQHRVPLDDRHALAEVGRLRRALFAGGAGADHDQIEVRCHLAIVVGAAPHGKPWPVHWSDGTRSGQRAAIVSITPLAV